VSGFQLFDHDPIEGDFEKRLALCNLEVLTKMMVVNAVTEKDVQAFASQPPRLSLLRQLLRKPISPNIQCSIKLLFALNCER
jgi:hypothetical protein